MIRQFLILISMLFVIALMPLAGQESADANLTDTCVAEGEFDPSVDYFPQKISVDYTAGFTVEYFNHYKLVTLLTPWSGAEPEDAVTYVLVQCGTPVPEAYEDAKIISVPVNSFVTMSTTYLPYVDAFDLLDRLVGVDLISTVTTESILQKAEAGELVEIAPNFQLDREVALSVQADMIMTYGFGFDTDEYLLLEEDGHNVVLNGEFADTAPLNRAEWGKYLALFFNEEAAAGELFEQVADEYTALVQLAADAETQPTVFVNSPFDGTWYMAGGESYIARFIADAGADYLWADDTSAMTLFLDFEAVFERAAEADFWINVDQFWFSLQDVTGADPRYADFAAVQKGQVWSNNLALTESFGNDFYESGVAFPNWILADLIAIFHPELLPDHEFVYYRHLGE